MVTFTLEEEPEQFPEEELQLAAVLCVAKALRLVGDGQREEGTRAISNRQHKTYESRIRRTSS